jgi:hypothetical protein
MARESLLQAMRTYLEQAESPHITMEAFCDLAGVSAQQYAEHYADIHELQLELVAELVMLDLSYKDAVNPSSGILQKMRCYMEDFWSDYQKHDFDAYERNVLRIAYIEVFQLTAETAAATRAIGRQHWCAWLQTAVEAEGLRQSISMEGWSDFHCSFQSSTGLLTAFAGASHRESAFKISAIQMRYLQRHLPVQEVA